MERLRGVGDDVGKFGDGDRASTRATFLGLDEQQRTVIEKTIDVLQALRPYRGDGQAGNRRGAAGGEQQRTDCDLVADPRDVGRPRTQRREQLLQRARRSRRASSGLAWTRCRLPWRRAWSPAGPTLPPGTHTGPSLPRHSSPPLSCRSSPELACAATSRSSDGSPALIPGDWTVWPSIGGRHGPASGRTGTRRDRRRHGDRTRPGKSRAAAGMKVAAADLNAPQMESTVAELQADGAEALGVPTAVRDPGAVEALARAAVDAFGRVDVVCNNAGVWTLGHPWRTPLEDWRWVVDVNPWGCGVRRAHLRPAAAGQPRRRPPDQRGLHGRAGGHADGSLRGDEACRGRAVQEPAGRTGRPHATRRDLRGLSGGGSGRQSWRWSTDGRKPTPILCSCQRRNRCWRRWSEPERRPSTPTRQDGGFSMRSSTTSSGVLFPAAAAHVPLLLRG